MTRNIGNSSSVKALWSNWGNRCKQFQFNTVSTTAKVCAMCNVLRRQEGGTAYVEVWEGFTEHNQ